MVKGEKERKRKGGERERERERGWGEIDIGDMERGRLIEGGENGGYG
jgi:hypothetical protein